MSDSYVKVRIDAPQGVLEIDRAASRNALDGAGWHGLVEGLRALTEAPDVRVVVLRATGSVFCAGGDLDWMRCASCDELQCVGDALADVAACPKPVVARIHGPVFGGGIGLVAACDWNIASARTRFTLSEVRIGLAPALIARTLIRRVGPARFRGWALRGATIDAATALSYGLLDEVVDDDAQLDDAVRSVVDCLVRGEPTALAEVKRLFPDGLETVAAATTLERLRRSDAFAEGIAAVRDGRKPSWVPPEQ